MNCLNSLLSKDGMVAAAVAGAGIGARDITGMSVGVPLPLVRAALTSSSSLAEEGFRQRLRQAQDPAITLVG